MILWELKKILTGKIALLLLMALGINLFIFYYTESLETQENPYFTPQRAEPLFIYSFIDSEVSFFWASFTALTDTAT